ncbi:MAG: TonB-dependent receptor [Kordiimonadaceae bacterium]|nr:TonB-dependent receptor [Kordiimonadaceae bacterium]
MQLEEILVTARRRSESLQDVPIAVTAFSAETLFLRGAADITEIAQIAPSVTLEPTRATSSTLTAFIRGVGQQDPLAGFEQGVAIYIDDVYLARPQGALVDIYDVERIEILRGPQGTLYGRNAVGGAIKYVTKRLSDEAGGSLKLSYGTYNQIDAVAKVSAPLSEKVRIGGTFASLNRGGFGENLTTGAEHYNKEILAGRVSMELMPSDTVFIRLAADYTKDTSNSISGHRENPAAFSGNAVLDDVYDTEAGATEHPSTAFADGRNQVIGKGFSGSIEWEVNDTIILKSVTAYREDETIGVIDFDGLPIDDLDAEAVYTNNQFSQEFQLQFDTGPLKGLLGFYYLDAFAANDFDVVLGTLGRAAFGGPLTAFTGGVVDTKAWSVFADATYEVNEKFSISLGGRYTSDKRSADIFRASYIGQTSPFFGTADAIQIAVSSDYENSRTFNDFSPRIAIDYAINDDTKVYAGFSRGFKAGSFDPRGANFVTPEASEGFDPETLDSYEAGLKTTFFDGRARTNIAVFYSNYKDLQVPSSVAVDTDGDGINVGFVGVVTNAGQSVIKGIEFEGEFLLTEALTFQTTFNILDAEIKEWILNGVDVSDQREVQNTPKFMAYVGLTYVMDMPNGTLTFNGSVSHKSSIVQFETPVPQIDQEPYELANANIVYIADNNAWSFGLHGKNLFDTRFKTAGYNFPTLGLENNVTSFFGPPLTVTATFKVNF